MLPLHYQAKTTANTHSRNQTNNCQPRQHPTRRFPPPSLPIPERVTRNHLTQPTHRFNLCFQRGGRDKISPPLPLCAGVAQLVEHHVANVVVEGSNPFTRSLKTPLSLVDNGVFAFKEGPVRPHSVARCANHGATARLGCSSPAATTCLPSPPTSSIPCTSSIPGGARYPEVRLWLTWRLLRSKSQVSKRTPEGVGFEHLQDRRESGRSTPRLPSGRPAWLPMTVDLPSRCTSSPGCSAGRR